MAEWKLSFTIRNLYSWSNYRNIISIGRIKGRNLKWTGVKRLDYQKSELRGTLTVCISNINWFQAAGDYWYSQVSRIYSFVSILNVYIFLCKQTLDTLSTCIVIHIIITRQDCSGLWLRASWSACQGPTFPY